MTARRRATAPAHTTTTYNAWSRSCPPGDIPPPLAKRSIHPEDRQAYATACEEATTTGELNTEWRVVLSDGSIRWLAETGRMERSGGGRRMLGVVQDVTNRKQTETRLTMLLAELQHRVRNILGVVRSVVARTVRSSSNVEELAASLDGRLDTLARTQSVFTRAGVNSVNLEHLVRDELVAVAARDGQLTIEGPGIWLKREAAEAFALALHELTTNAVKYGALSEPAGGLSVTWRLLNTSKGSRLALEWRESGVRALNVRPSRSGARWSSPAGGVKALIALPLTDGGDRQ